MNEETRRRILQYTHLEKLYGYLPGMAKAQPAIFDVSPAEFADVLGRFDAQARAAARELIADDGFATLVDALPFPAQATVLAVGDSCTDDLQSWAVILQHVLDLRRPADGVRVVNGGLSGHTTAMHLARWPATLAATQPQWIICGLGGNDVCRIGTESAKPLVSPAESLANLTELRRIAAAASDVAWVWLTPTPVHEQRVDEFVPFRYTQTSWRNTDIAVLVDAMESLTDPIVDLTTVFGVPADPDLQGVDGVHPTLAGQIAITRALVRRLANQT